LSAGPTGKRVKDVANALDAGLIVTSCNYHRRLLNYLTHTPTGTLRLQGVACPVVLVDDASVMPGGDDARYGVSTTTFPSWIEHGYFDLGE
jgi:hypothetical protein